MTITKFTTATKAFLAQTALIAGIFGAAIFAAPTIEAQAAENPSFTKKAQYIVATNAAYAPFEFLNEKGEMVGFDVDLMNYVCKQIDINCVWQNTAFDSLIPNLKFKKIDFAIADMNITPERLKQVAFSDEYLPAATSSYLVNKDKGFTKQEQLKVVGFQAGTLAGKYLAKQKQFDSKVFESYELAMLNLKAGRIDAVLADDEYIKVFAADPQLVVLGAPVKDEVFGKGPGIATHPNNKALLEAVNKALMQAKESGFIDQLKVKYDLAK